MTKPQKRITPEDISEYFSRVKPVDPKQIAIELLEDPNHPIASISKEDFRFSDIFENVIIDYTSSDKKDDV